MERQEVMHQVLGLKIYRNTFQVISISLDNSNQCNLSSWKGSVDDTFKFLSHGELRDDKETVNESQQCKELMYIARIVGPPQGNHSVGCDN